MRLAAICDNDTAVGLRLAGIKEVYVLNENALNMWNEIRDRDDIGVLFITEKIAEYLENYLKEFRLIHNIPIIVEIPDKKGHMKDHIDFVSLLIKKAVGIEMNK